MAGVTVKPEMLAAPLQPSTAARAPTGLNRMCPPPGNTGTRPPQQGPCQGVGGESLLRHQLSWGITIPDPAVVMLRGT